MRFTYFLFVATATLLSSCNASVAFSGDTQAKLSTMTSTDATVRAHAVDASNMKRHLRSHHDQDEENEERLNPALLSGDDLAAWTAKWSAKADDWIDEKHSPTSLKILLGDYDMGEKNDNLPKTPKQIASFYLG
ncbi:hypothetical protein PF010_g13952 [Phytophthora fragariae]|uniref:RxLR effector protein n=1 Tax=Phytophthora fragariae TaxID=53985 RepID=A0A6G0N7F4_9STRA|nr:hypothetical protein PF010_g13952 [Phytophthora fragariae]KAE9195309.1 hypothetical protein PF004_g20464 [Phytophthora fragariae]